MIGTQTIHGFCNDDIKKSKLFDFGKKDVALNGPTNYNPIKLPAAL